MTQLLYCHRELPDLKKGAGEPGVHRMTESWPDEHFLRVSSPHGRSHETHFFSAPCTTLTVVPHHAALADVLTKLGHTLRSRCGGRVGCAASRRVRSPRMAEDGANGRPYRWHAHKTRPPGDTCSSPGGSHCSALSSATTKILPRVTALRARPTASLSVPATTCDDHPSPRPDTSLDPARHARCREPRRNPCRRAHAFEGSGWSRRKLRYLRGAFSPFKPAGMSSR